MPEEKTEEKTEELTEEQVAAAAAATEAAAKETEGTEKAAEKTYAELGLDARYDGMDRAQLAEDIKHRNTVHGRQSTEVGTLRKDLAAAQAKLDGFAKAAGVSVEAKEVIEDMDEAELGVFLTDLQSNPRKAFTRILGKGMGRRSDDDLKKLFMEFFDEGIGQYHDYTGQQTAQADPDYQIHAGYMESLRLPENFGNTRPAQELLAFAKLADVPNADKALVDALYSDMKRYPQVSMKDCLNMVTGRTGGKAKVDPDKIREQVDSLTGGKLPSGAKKKSSTEKIETMDDAFSPDGVDA